MNKRLLGIFGFIFWSLLVLGGYYYFHKPVTIAETAAPLSAMLNLLVAAALIALCGGLGRLLARAPGLNGLARMAFEAALGIGVAATLWLLLGVLGLYRTWLAWLLLMAGLFFLRNSVRDWFREWSDLRGWWRAAGRFEQILLAIGLLFALNQLWIALSPPIKYDALSYHLQLPRLYLAAGRLTFEPQLVYWGHPQIAEMLYTWAMSLASTTAAAAFGWMAGLLAVLGAASLASSFFPGSKQDRNAAAVFAALALLAAPTVREMLAWSYNDLFSALFGVAAFGAFYAWQSSGQRSWLYWLGLCVGFAVGTKFTAGVLALALYPALLLIPGRARPALKDWLISGLFALLAFAPWAVKNLVYTGNPVFPYFIPTLWYSAERLDMAHSLPEPIGWAQTLLAPLWLTWQGIDSAPGPGSDIGALLILFAIPGLFFYRRSREGKPLVFDFLLAWLIIALAGARIDHLRQTRLYFVLFVPLLGMAAGWGWAALKGIHAQGVRLGRVAGTLILLVLFLSLWQDTLRLAKNGAPQVLLGITSAEQYLEQNTGAYIDAMTRLEQLPSDKRVLMLWEARGLYAPVAATADPWIDRWRADLRDLGSGEAVLSAWRSQGYTHLLLFRYGLDLIRADDPILSPAEWKELDDLFASLPPAQPFPGGFYELYTLSTP